MNQEVFGEIYCTDMDADSTPFVLLEPESLPNDPISVEHKPYAKIVEEVQRLVITIFKCHRHLRTQKIFLNRFLQTLKYGV